MPANDEPSRDHEASTRSRVLAAALALYALLALALALHRLPYDDEWFSLTLLTEVGPTGFWQSLAHDMHPPWLALLDRAVYEAWGGRAPLHLARISMSVGAVAALAMVARRRLGVPVVLAAFAALHPVVFFYAGALRWYPLLFLGHALRHFALWSGSARGRRRGALVVGSLVGSAAAYLDALFLLHDLAWWWKREPRAESRRDVALALGVAASTHIGSLVLAGNFVRVWHFGGAALRAPGALSWAALGPAGEAQPFTALFAFAPLVAAAGALGLWRTCDARGERAFFGFLGSLVACWLLATLTGVFLPRYSLEPWWWMTLGLLCLAQEARLRLRLVAFGSLAVVLSGAASTLAGSGFAKADLNALPAELCPALVPDDGTQLYVVPYHRLHAQVEQGCGFPAPALHLPNIRHTSDAREQLRSLRAALPHARAVTLLLSGDPTAYSGAQQRAQAELEARCRRVSERGLWRAPHAALRARVHGNTPRPRIARIRYACPGQADD